MTLSPSRTSARCATVSCCGARCHGNVARILIRCFCAQRIGRKDRRHASRLFVVGSSLSFDSRVCNMSIIAQNLMPGGGARVRQVRNVAHERHQVARRQLARAARHCSRAQSLVFQSLAVPLSICNGGLVLIAAFGDAATALCVGAATSIHSRGRTKKFFFFLFLGFIVFLFSVRRAR